MRQLLCVFALTLSTCVATSYTCATCSSYAHGVGQDATQYCQDRNSKCWSPSDCSGQGEVCNVDNDHPAEYPPGGSKGTGIATCNACSSYEYLEGAGEAYYCQDSNNKCWNSIDCTGVGSLCQAAKAGCASKKYTWIGASAGSDDWCNENCNHNPSFCPPFFCVCTGAVCYHNNDAPDHKCYEACSTGAPFYMKGITTGGRCDSKVYNIQDSETSVYQCPDGITNTKYCAKTALNITVATYGEHN